MHLLWWRRPPFWQPSQTTTKPLLRRMKLSVTLPLFRHSHKNKLLKAWRRSRNVRQAGWLLRISWQSRKFLGLHSEAENSVSANLFGRRQESDQSKKKDRHFASEEWSVQGSSQWIAWNCGNLGKGVRVVEYTNCPNPETSRDGLYSIGDRRCSRLFEASSSHLQRTRK